MNAYADLTMIANKPWLEYEDDQLSVAFKVNVRKVLEEVSREIDNQTLRHFYVKDETRYFDGTGSRLRLEDLLSVTTLKLDEDGDQTFEVTMASTDYFLYPLNFFPKMEVKISSNSDYSGFAGGVLRGVEIDGSWGYGDGISATPYTDAGTDVNDASVTATVTTITVDNGAAFSVGQTIRIDTEQMYIKSIVTNVLAVLRAVNGTTGATHDDDSDIYIYNYPADITQVCLIESIRAIQAGNWLDVTGSPETVTFSVKKGFHPKSLEILKDYLRYGW